jgi:hypothetical protein
MTVNRDTLKKLGRFLLRGLRIGASTVAEQRQACSGIPSEQRLDRRPQRRGCLAGVSAGGAALAARQLGARRLILKRQAR